MSEEIKYNSEIFLANLNLQPTDTALFINGLFCDIDTMDIFALVDVLRSEVRTTERLFKIGMVFIINALHLLNHKLNYLTDHFRNNFIRNSAIIFRTFFKFRIAKRVCP